MLKPQDCVLLLKLIAQAQKNWSQRELAQTLCVSQSEVHSGLKRLKTAELIRIDQESNSPLPIRQAALEYVIHGVRYSFPARAGELTRGMPTGVGAPVFAGKLAMGTSPIPVWPFAEGSTKGVALKPLYPSVPSALNQFPDSAFYDLLALVDILRTGQARERGIATKMLEERFQYGK